MDWTTKANLEQEGPEQSGGDMCFGISPTQILPTQVRYDLLPGIKALLAIAVLEWLPVPAGPWCFWTWALRFFLDLSWWAMKGYWGKETKLSRNVPSWDIQTKSWVFLSFCILRKSRNRMLFLGGNTQRIYSPFNPLPKYNVGTKYFSWVLWKKKTLNDGAHNSFGSQLLYQQVNSNIQNAFHFSMFIQGLYRTWTVTGLSSDLLQAL